MADWLNVASFISVVSAIQRDTVRRNDLCKVKCGTRNFASVSGMLCTNSAFIESWNQN